jgi:hypothetical protein
MTNSSSFSFLLWNIFFVFCIFLSFKLSWFEEDKSKDKNVERTKWPATGIFDHIQNSIEGDDGGGRSGSTRSSFSSSCWGKKKTIHNSISLSVIELVSECLLFGWSDRHKKSPPPSFCTLSRGKWNISVEESLSLSKRNEMMRKVENPEEWLWPQPWRWNCFFFKYIMNQRWVCSGGILLLLFSISCRRTKIFLAPVGVDWNQETKAYFV